MTLGTDRDLQLTGIKKEAPQGLKVRKLCSEAPSASGFGVFVVFIR